MKSKILVFLVFLILFAGGLRIYRVNQECKIPEPMEYSKGVTIELGNNTLFNGNLDGYSIQVTQADILTIEEYQARYQSENPDFVVENLLNLPDKVYDVTVIAENNGAESASGIDFANFYLQNHSYYTDLHTGLYEFSNPKAQGNLMIALRNDSFMEFHLPFNLTRERLTDGIWKDLEMYPLSMVVSLYPQKKTIHLLEN